MSTTLQAQARGAATKGGLRQLRRAGKIPGVVYGKELGTPSPIALNEKDLKALLRGGAHSILDLNVAGQGSHSVLLTDVQREPLSGQVLHVDFHQINLNETIKAFVRLDVNGVSPGEKEGGMLQLVMHELEVECVARDLPSVIAVDIDSLGVGDHLTVGELTLPAGVKAAGDPESVVLAVLAPQKDRTEDELEAMDDAAEEHAQHSKMAQTVEMD